MRRSALLVLTSLVFGATATVAAPASVAAAVPSAGAHTIAATYYDTVFIGGDGKVYGTGRNELGEITGTGPRTEPAALTGLPSGVRAVSVSGGAAEVIVLGSNGVVYGTGAGEEGQITGSSDRSTLTKLTGLPAGVKATSISSGDTFSLVLGSDGHVYGTGENSDDQLTTAAPFEATTLTRLTGMGSVRAVAIAAGSSTTVVLGADGRVYGAGNSEFGQLNDTSTSPVTTLTPFGDLPFGVRIVAIAASQANVVLLGSDGTAFATGGNGSGQLGLGVTDNDSHSAPVALPVSDVVGISAGLSAIGLIRKGGLVVVAGNNDQSQLTGTTQPVMWFEPLALSAGVPTSGSGSELVMGRLDTLVRDSYGIVYGAGDNSYSQLTGAPPSGNVEPSLVVLGGQKVLNTGLPTVTGRVKVGRTLTGHVGSWKVSASHYTYQWLRNGTAIHSATTATYKLVSADKGKKISLRVTGSRSGFTAGTATSASRGPVSA